MNLYPVNTPTCGCDADRTFETTVQSVRRGNPPQVKRAKRIHHERDRDGARFWHWSDQEVIRI